MDLVPTIFVSSTLMPRRSGRIVIQPDRFMYLGESFKSFPEEHEIDPINYDETMSNVDVHLCQKAIEANLKSMYSNQVWELVEAP